ncbi:PREDICTED: pentatricopeptide repeat-containing protein At2g40720 [Nelumbo nucifera]|uniref:Uncharacterized protein n=2 Tax=Nelumbo nucifera TaxID=4432 RepID=A0A822XZG5_NELNU|nr:PREDICTED: pentatricopeptide repeat-containing protein At2g40720 [Nelumbo nucifera]DAD25770.1 TPA_asm: hypothetical protein HUJ06_027238 [Nelumbo nucifera]
MHFNRLLCRRFSNVTQSVLSSSSLVNARIRAFVQQGLYSEALQLLYSNNYQSNSNSSPSSHSSPIPDKFTFPSLLKACAALSDIRNGRQIHAAIIALGLQFDPYIATSLINMYVKCGSISSASQVFAAISESEVEASVRDVSLWNSIIDGYFRFGRIDDGLFQFRRMQSLGVRPDAYSLSILLGICNNPSNLAEGTQIHAYILARNMFGNDPFLQSALINMYSKCHRPLEAWMVFDMLEDKTNVVIWNAMIGGFCENELWEKSLEYFALVKKENFRLGSSTVSSVLSACSQGEYTDFGRQVHCDAIKMGLEGHPYVCTSLLTMYARCGLIEDSEEIFNHILDREIELWNAMISAYIINDCIEQALDAYKEMRLLGLTTDSFTISNILSACSLLDLYDLGRNIHGELIKRSVQSSVAVQSALLTMYAKCGSTEDACSVFSSIEKKDTVSWCSMMSGLCQNGKFEEALNFFSGMVGEGIKPDSVLMATVVNACVGLENVELGCGFHGFIIKGGMVSDVFVGSALIDVYSKCGLPDKAESIFSDMPHKNLVAWNSLITCYCRNNLPGLVISLFPQILQYGLTPNSVSIANTLVAVSSIAILIKGKALHAYQLRLGIQSDLHVGNALIDMYIKCGCLTYAQRIFESMPMRNIITWNSMVGGYGSHGEGSKAIELFDDMQGLGVLPDEVTFLALISSCSHSGLTEEGLCLFQSMKRDYAIEPRMEHYVNMVDLWGRAGHLTEAYGFIQSMPIEPDMSVWLCLLSACRAHGNIELGEIAASNLLKMEPSRGSNYTQLLNLYREAELWDKAANLRVSMKEKGLKKSPGCSWIEVRNGVDVFFSGDSSSPRTVEVCETLWSLKRNMERETELSLNCYV